MQEVSCAAESGGCAFETGGSAGPQPHGELLEEPRGRIFRTAGTENH